eukprot:189682_1
MEQPLNFNHIFAELRAATRELSIRGLFFAAKWSAELMVAVKDQLQSHEVKSESSPEQSSSQHVSEDETLLAKAYFDMKEFRRAAHCLERCSSPYATFLKCYSLFLAGEKRKEEEIAERSDSSTSSQVENSQLPILRKELGLLYKERGLDGFGLYLFGLIQKHSGQREAAIDLLVESVNVYPLNWSAWKALVSLCHDKDTVLNLKLSDHWMKQFFLVDVYLELQMNSNELLPLLTRLRSRFPQSAHVLAQEAVMHYTMRQLDEAHERFEELKERDPFRLETMDTYSNVLYVKDCAGELSFLAHKAVQIDKFSPETQYIIGNYHSLKGEHEKSVLSFQRALKLNPGYLSALTLMGHAYVELKNSSSAIGCYRRAVDMDPRDFRAWYGLGQTYEMMKMYSYAIYYYRKACLLRPYDSRMWCGMASCYEKLDRSEEAIKCFLRAEGNSDDEGIALFRLAKLYAKRNNQKQAAHYYRAVIHRCSGAKDEVDQQHPQQVIDALLYLAEYCKSNQHWEEATSYCERLLDVGGSIREQAKSMLHEIHQMKTFMASRQSTRGATGFMVPTTPILTPSHPRNRTRAPLTTVNLPVTPGATSESSYPRSSLGEDDMATSP